MKVITRFTSHKTEEGQRISYSFSEIDENGNPVRQNERGSFVVTDPLLQSSIDYINNCILERL